MEQSQNIKDLSMRGVKNIKDFEELVQRSIDNGALNKYEGREIFKRLNHEKKEISQETREKLLEVAQKGNWVALARKLQEISKVGPITTPEEKPVGPEKKDQEASKELLKDTKTTQGYLEFMIGDVVGKKLEIISSKKWDSLSFWNTESKKVTLDILEQLLGVLESLKNQPHLTHNDVKKAIDAELSTSEGGERYRNIRDKMKNEIISVYFSGEQFSRNAKQMALKNMRENLAGGEIKRVFELEIGAPYTPGMKVPDDKKWLLREYEQTFDPKNEWTKISDESANTAKGVFAYDVTSLVASGVGTGVVVKGGTKVLGKMIARESATEVVASGRAVNALKGGVSAVAEGTTFTALYEGIRHQEWFLNQEDSTKKVVMNSLMFGLYKGVEALPVSFLKGIEAKNPKIFQLTQGLYKQGLVAPALFVTAMVSYDALTQAQQKTLGDWIKEFILVGVISGAFHLGGIGAEKIVEGIPQKTKINTETKKMTLEKPDGKQIEIPLTQKDIQKVTSKESPKDVPTGFVPTKEQLQNLSAHGIVVEKGYLELKGYWNIIQVYLGKSASLSSITKMELKNSSKNILHITLTDMEGKTSQIIMNKRHGVAQNVTLVASNGETKLYHLSKTTDVGVEEASDDIVIQVSAPTVQLPIGEKLPEKKQVVQALEVAYKDMQKAAKKTLPVEQKVPPTSSGTKAEEVVMAKEVPTPPTAPLKKETKEVGPTGNNFLLDFFSGDKIQKTFSQGLNPRLMLINGAKGNIQLSLTRTGELKSGSILMDGKNFRFTMVNDEMKITLDEIKNPNINKNTIGELLESYTKN